MAASLDRSIAPGPFDEHGVAIEKQARPTYRFDTGAPVVFDICHQRGGQVPYPVKRDRVRRLEGRCRAQDTDDYGLMGQNKGNKAVAIRGVVEY